MVKPTNRAVSLVFIAFSPCRRPRPNRPGKPGGGAATALCTPPPPPPVSTPNLAETCALWGFRAGGWRPRGAPGVLETARRGASDPAAGRKTPDRAFVQGQNAPVRAMRASRPPRFRGGRLWPAGPDRERLGGGASRSAGVGPEPAPAKAGGTGPYSERIRSGRPARTCPNASAIITDSAKPTRVRIREERHRELRAVPGDHHVGEAGEARAGPGRVPAHRRDDRLREGDGELGDPRHLREPLLHRGRVPAPHRLHVAPGAEVPARPGEHRPPRGSRGHVVGGSAPGNACVSPAFSFTGCFTPMCGRDARVPRMARPPDAVDSRFLPAFAGMTGNDGGARHKRSQERMRARFLRLR